MLNCWATIYCRTDGFTTFNKRTNSVPQNSAQLEGNQKQMFSEHLGLFIKHGSVLVLLIWSDPHRSWIRTFPPPPGSTETRNSAFCAESADVNRLGWSAGLKIWSRSKQSFKAHLLNVDSPPRFPCLHF